MPAPVIRVNDEVLASVMKVAADLSAKLAAPPPTVDGILAIKGVLEVSEPDDTEAERQAAEAAILKAFEQALSGLVEMRRREGTSLQQILASRLDEIAALAKARGCGARPAGGRGQGETRPSRSRCCWNPRNVSMPTGCIRKRS